MLGDAIASNNKKDVGGWVGGWVVGCYRSRSTGLKTMEDSGPDKMELEVGVRLQTKPRRSLSKT